MKRSKESPSTISKDIKNHPNQAFPARMAVDRIRKPIGIALAAVVIRSPAVHFREKSVDLGRKQAGILPETIDLEPTPIDFWQKSIGRALQPIGIRQQRDRLHVKRPFGLNRLNRLPQPLPRNRLHKDRPPMIGHQRKEKSPARLNPPPILRHVFFNTPKIKDRYSD
jgi:hypothetical protein